MDHVCSVRWKAVGANDLCDSDKKVSMYEKVSIYYVYREPSANEEINNLIT